MLPEPGLLRLVPVGAWFAKPIARFFEGRSPGLMPGQVEAPCWQLAPGAIPTAVLDGSARRLQGGRCRAAPGLP